MVPLSLDPLSFDPLSFDPLAMNPNLFLLDPLALNLDPLLLVSGLGNLTIVDLKKKNPKAMLNRGSSRSSHWILQQTRKKNSLGHSMAATDVTE